MPHDDDAPCPMCETPMEKGDLDGNWREYWCPECETDVLRPVASDHGDGMTMEDLNNITAFNNQSQSSNSDADTGE